MSTEQDAEQDPTKVVICLEGHFTINMSDLERIRSREEAARAAQTVIDGAGPIADRLTADGGELAVKAGFTVDDAFALSIEEVEWIRFVGVGGRSWEMIPKLMRSGLWLWVNNGHHPGSFLSALLANNLTETFRRADDQNGGIIGNYARFLYNWCPAPCYGSPEKVKDWAALGGLHGMRAKEAAELAAAAAGEAG